MSDEHVCQCKYCGRLLNPPQIYFSPVPQPPQCEHDWRGLSTWSAGDGEHASRRCVKCGLYQQW